MERSSDENKYGVGHKQEKLVHNILTQKYEPDTYPSQSPAIVCGIPKDTTIYESHS
jgi:hypothetical protein